MGSTGSSASFDIPITQHEVFEEPVVAQECFLQGGASRKLSVESPYRLAEMEASSKQPGVHSCLRQVRDGMRRYVITGTQEGIHKFENHAMKCGALVWNESSSVQQSTQVFVQCDNIKHLMREIAPVIAKHSIRFMREAKQWLTFRGDTDALDSLLIA